MPLITVALIFGGKSTEHEISIISAKSIAANISTSRYKVIPFYITREGVWFSEGIAGDILNLDLSALLRASSQAAVSSVLSDKVDRTAQKPFDFDFNNLEHKKIYCSELVWLIFEKAGLFTASEFILNKPIYPKYFLKMNRLMMVNYKKPSP